MAKLVLSNLDFNAAARVVNLPDPTSAQDAATKAYVDAAIEGLKTKDNVRVRTASNINLSSPGAALDGVTMAVNERFLASAQSTGSQNGIYVFNGAAVAATRAPDANTAAEVTNAVVWVAEGTSAGTQWRQTATGVTLGTTALVWASFGSGVGAANETSAGIAEIATQAETNAGTDDARMVTPLKLASYTGFTRKFAASIGDGSATQYDVTHNLGTLDVHVEVFANSGGATVLCDVTRTSTTVVRLNFAAAPSSNQFRVVVVG